MPLRVLFIPWWPEKNPYQRLLAAELERLGARVESLDSLRRAPFRRPPDVVHLHWLHFVFADHPTWLACIRAAAFTVGLVVLRLMRVRLFWTVHNLADHDGRGPLLDRICSCFAARLSRRLIAHSASAKTRIVRALGVRESKVIVIPHGHFVGHYDNSIGRNEARRLLRLSEEDFVFVSLGTIRRYKGLFELVQAFKALDPADARLMLAGAPADPKAAAELRLAMAQDGRISWAAEFVASRAIQTYLNAADVAVFPYRDVLTSGAVALAMSFGRACIVPRHECLAETLDERGAFFYAPGATAGLGEAMRRAIEAKADLAAMGAHNLKKILTNGWDVSAAMTLAAYGS